MFGVRGAHRRADRFAFPRKGGSRTAPTNIHGQTHRSDPTNIRMLTLPWAGAGAGPYKKFFLFVFIGLPRRSYAKAGVY